MLGYDDFKSAFDDLNLQQELIIAHASLKPFGYIQGGAEAVLEAMRASFYSIIMPTFTYKTKIIPDVGPPNNGITYGSGKDTNRLGALLADRHRIGGLEQRHQASAVLHEVTPVGTLDRLAVDLLEPRDEREGNGLEVVGAGAKHQKRQLLAIVIVLGRR